MLLTLDIGNSGRPKYAVFDSGELIARGDMSDMMTDATFPYRSKITHYVIASVNPELTKIFSKFKVSEEKSLKALKVGRDIKIPIENMCAQPKRVGDDRLVNAVAAFDKHRRACIVVDVGTAVTVDAIDEKGRFLGGAILPGPKLQMEALCGGTALLPKVSLARPESPIGGDTEPAVRSGVYWGVVGAINELVELFERELGGGCRVVLAGGAGGIFREDLARVDDYDEILTLRGIKITFERGELKDRRKR